MQTNQDVLDMIDPMNPGNQCPCCGPNKQVVACHACHQPGHGNIPLMRCVGCKAVWYCSKPCQVAHWKEHKIVCQQLAQQTDVIRGKFHDKDLHKAVAPVTAETMAALNALTKSATFFVHPGDGNFWVSFRTGAACKLWCNHMNETVFADQKGMVPFVREGKGAKRVGAVFRFPVEFDHLIRYIGSGRIYFENGIWKIDAPPRETGHWEYGYGIEPFAEWVERQLARLSVGARLLDVETSS